MKRHILKAVSKPGASALPRAECSGLGPGLLIWQGNLVVDVNVNLTPEGRSGSQMKPKQLGASPSTATYSTDESHHLSKP
jgi:hypothetical protein